MFTPHAIERGKTPGCWGVALHHEESGKIYWMDVSLNTRDHEFEIDWNQYIFYNTDPDDMERKDFQEDAENFEEAVEACYQVLQEQKEVTVGDEGELYLKKAWKGGKSWTL